MRDKLDIQWDRRHPGAPLRAVLAGIVLLLELLVLAPFAVAAALSSVAYAGARLAQRARQ